MNASSCERGLTFLELLVTLSLCIVLAVMSFPRLAAIAGSARLTQEAQRVTAFLDQASSRAQASAEKLTLRLAPHALQLTSSQHSESLILSDEVFLDAASDNEEMAFHPSGAASARTLQLRRAGKSCHVVISLRGRTRWSCP